MNNQTHIILSALVILLFNHIYAASGSYKSLYEQGIQYEESLKLKLSADAFNKALKIKPKSNEALDGLSRVCRGIIGKRPGDLKTRKIYLDAVRNSKDTGRLIKSLEFVISRAPKAHPVRYELAQINLADGDKPKAYKQIRKALRVKPVMKKYRFFLLKTLESDASYKENFKLLQKMALGKKASLEAKLAYAKVCLLRNRKTSASKQYLEIYKRDKTALKGDSSAAEMFLRLKKYDIARDMALDYLKDNPDNIPVREVLVKCYLIDSTDNKTLRAAIKKIVEIDPDTKKWWLKLAKLDIDAGDRKASLKHTKIWVERNPKSRAGYKFLITLVARDSTERKAYKNALETLIKLEPKKSRDRRKLLGLLKFDEGKYKEAEKLLTMSVKHYPKDHRVWFALGQSRLKLGFQHVFGCSGFVTCKSF